MVEMDFALLHEARQLITGANVHRLKQMIFVYEQAVSLHNYDWPTHHIYQPEHEQKLRRFVAKEKSQRAA